MSSRKIPLKAALVIHPPRSDDEEEMERKQKDLLFRQDCTVIYKFQKVQFREDLLIQKMNSMVLKSFL